MTLHELRQCVQLVRLRRHRVSSQEFCVLCAGVKKEKSCRLWLVDLYTDPWKCYSTLIQFVWIYFKCANETVEIRTRTCAPFLFFYSQNLFLGAYASKMLALYSPGPVPIYNFDVSKRRLCWSMGKRPAEMIGRNRKNSVMWQRGQTM